MYILIIQETGNQGYKTTTFHENLEQVINEIHSQFPEYEEIANIPFLGYKQFIKEIKKYFNNNDETIRINVFEIPVQEICKIKDNPPA